MGELRSRSRQADPVRPRVPLLDRSRVYAGPGWHAAGRRTEIAGV